MSAFLDVTDLHDDCCNHGMELLHKQRTEGQKDIWAMHENQAISELVEVFTKGGITRLDAMWSAIQGFIHGKAGDFRVLEGPHRRLTPSELDLLRTLLESRDPSTYSINEWMLVVDYLIERYLPQDFPTTESDWLARRAVFMGRVQANIDSPIQPEQAAFLLRFADRQPMTPTVERVIAYGIAHCAENIRAMTETSRHRIKTTILNYKEAVDFGGTKWSAGVESLQTRLFDQFGEMNRDWRRIAVTETGEMTSQAFIAGVSVGGKVKRVEMYDACPFCKKLDGMEFTVVGPDAQGKESRGWDWVWVGKTNVGRSASPMKKVGDTLIARDIDELWWPAAGVQHVHCRGSWLPVGAGASKVADKDFAKYLDELWKKS